MFTSSAEDAGRVDAGHPDDGERRRQGGDDARNHNRHRDVGKAQRQLHRVTVHRQDGPDSPDEREGEREAERHGGADLSQHERQRAASSQPERAQDRVVAQLREREAVSDERGDRHADDEADEGHAAHDVGGHVADQAPLRAGEAFT